MRRLHKALFVLMAAFICVGAISSGPTRAANDVAQIRLAIQPPAASSSANIFVHVELINTTASTIVLRTLISSYGFAELQLTRNGKPFEHDRPIGMSYRWRIPVTLAPGASHVFPVFHPASEGGNSEWTSLTSWNYGNLPPGHYVMTAVPRKFTLSVPASSNAVEFDIVKVTSSDQGRAEAYVKAAP